MLNQEKALTKGCDLNKELEECSERDIKIATIWTAATASLNFSCLLGGILLDYLGPKITNIIGKRKEIKKFIFKDLFKFYF
jgi:hypothetical protein